MPPTRARSASAKRPARHSDEPYDETYEDQRYDNSNDEYDEEEEEDEDKRDNAEADDEGTYAEADDDEGTYADAYDDDDDDDDAYAEHEAEVATPGDAAKAAVAQVTQLTAKQPEGITAIEPIEGGGWRVCVEVVEDRRIPSSADILAIYEAAIDSSGELSSYRRIRRYGRGHGDGG